MGRGWERVEHGWEGMARESDGIFGCAGANLNDYRQPEVHQGLYDNSVSLSWNSVTNAHRYRLEQGTSSSGPWTDVGSETSGTTKTATGLA